MTRALLLLPTATYRAGAFLDAAQRLGVEVVVGSERRQALEEIMEDRFLLLPLNRPSEAADTVVRYAQTHRLDAVVAVDDQGSLTAAMACQRLGLRTSPPAAVAATRDKSALRELLHRAALPQPRFRLAGGAHGSAGEVAGRIGFPVVLKPRTLAASRGVIRADDEAAAEAAHQRIEAILASAGELDSSILIEEFVPGPEVAVEGLVRGGELAVLAVFDKPDPLDGPFFEETIYVTPSRLDSPTLDIVTGTVLRAVSALGLTEGPVHAELRIDVEQSVAYVIEVAARTIGGRCSQALTFSTGSTLEELVLVGALGIDSPVPDRADAASGVMMIPIPASGTLESVEGLDEARAVAGVRGIDITTHPGQVIQALPEGDRYLGFIFAAGDSPEAVELALRDAHTALKIDISPQG